MDLTSGQLGIEGKSAVIFEMDGQIYKFAGQTENGEFSISVSSSNDEGSGVLGIVLVVIAVLVLLGAGAFFFIEFEEIVDEDDLVSDDSTPEVDPYAWAKKAPAIPAQEPQAQPVQEARPPLPQRRPSIQVGFGTLEPINGSLTPTISNLQHSDFTVRV